MEKKRANPEAILANLKREETRGKLTVFLGAMAGVGKTYSMLRVARERMEEGLDVVIGWVETHGRRETEALVAGLPLVPPRSLEYRGKTFREMDLDALLNRRPQIALVDELAHTNIPGSRHARRYQDVEELLAAGIDVYTTLNVQHIESLNDVVARITGVTVQETVPDRILEDAFQIQLIDIPPEELTQRLKEGKVYVPGQAEKALKKFFRLGNINAMREIALRYTAQKVDQQLANYMQAHAIVGPWPVQEKIMVCVSASPFSSQLIRKARRLAARLHTQWFAVYVETPRRLPIGEKEKEQLVKNLRFAEDLGAEIITVIGNDVAREVLELARKHNVNQILIGKPLKSKLWEWLHGSVADKLIRDSEGVTIHIITHSGESVKPTRPAPLPKKDFSLSPWLPIVLMDIILTILAGLLEEFLGPVNIVLIYLLPVLYSAFRWGVGPAIWAAFLGIIIFNFFFIHPRLTFTVGDLRYLFSFAIFVIVALSMGTVAGRLRLQINNARRREISTNALYGLSKEIAAVNDLESLLKIVVRRIKESVEGEIAVFLPNEKGKLEVRPKGFVPHDVFLEENERAVAVWVLERGQMAGRGTDTLVGASALYLPLKEKDTALGVLGVYPLSSEIHLPGEEEHLLIALANLTAMAINRIKLTQQAQEAEVLAESERLHAALFDSLSHELRTPLASIIGAVSSLVEEEDVYDAQARRELLLNIQQGASRMNVLVNNLLDMARLESGHLQLKKELCEIEDIIGAAIQRLGEPLAKRKLEVMVAPDLPLVEVDFVLIEQVLINLLENALKYSFPNTPLWIEAKAEGRQLLISIINQGEPIPVSDLEQIFDKFYRIKGGRKVIGSGLGLAICKGIMEAHGGNIWANNQPADKVSFTFTLPIPKKKAQGIREKEL